MTVPTREEIEELAEELYGWADGDVREIIKDHALMGLPVTTEDGEKWASLMEKAAAALLSLSQRLEEVERERVRLRNTLKLHAGDTVSLSNEVDMWKERAEEAEAALRAPPSPVPPRAPMAPDVERVARAIEPMCYGLGDTKIAVAREIARAAIAAMPGTQSERDAAFAKGAEMMREMAAKYHERLASECEKPRPFTDTQAALMHLRYAEVIRSLPLPAVEPAG